MPHVPDTVLGKLVTGTGARTDGREASRQTSEVGAVCRKAARTVLCGGRPVMGVPTAIATRHRQIPTTSRRHRAGIFAEVIATQGVRTCLIATGNQWFESISPAESQVRTGLSRE